CGGQGAEKPGGGGGGGLGPGPWRGYGGPYRLWPPGAPSRGGASSRPGAGGGAGGSPFPQAGSPGPEASGRFKGSGLCPQGRGGGGTQGGFGRFD
ncbi:hypothetical protein ABTN72_18855, partial [Acinetobacter baumannii]